MDHSETFASIGLYSPDQARRKTEQESKQTVLETIGEIGEDWRTITESRGRAFIDVLLKNARFYNTVDLVQAWVPEKPEITWEGGSRTRTDFSQFNLDISWITHVRPEMQYHKGPREISVNQWHKVEIEYTGTVSDVIKLGREAAEKLNIKA
jgi:hypothetical protein